ncbi:MAG: nickel-dependent lactate racemase [Nitrososphaerota archaeon]|nr:nickel-dependent lactate racemase [Nitrososphaerota archaeon]
MVDVWLPYGKTDVCVRVPARNLLGSIVPVQTVGVSDVKKEFERALSEPIGGSRRLSEFIKPESKVVIVLDNDSCGCKSFSDFLLVVLAELNAVGVVDERITVIFGSDGFEAVASDACVVLGEEVLKRVRVVTHDVKSADLVYVGTTRSHGNKVFLNPVFVAADVRILLGGVGVHYYAGYSGGRSGVLSGVCGVETIRYNTAMMLNGNAKAGVLEDNPVHEDMTEIARLAKVDFIVNFVENSKGELVKVFAGDLEAAFLEAVKFVNELYKITVNSRADIVVVSAGGHLLDLTLYQACTALENALDVVKRNGVIVLVAECSKGYGNQVFYDWMNRLTDLKSTEKEIKRTFALGGHKAYGLLKILQNHPIILLSSLPDYYATTVFKLKTARAVNDALTEAFKLAGSASRVWTIPAGYCSLPEYKAPEDLKN